MAEADLDVGAEKDFEVIISELDMDSGACRLTLVDDPDGRVAGKITDPLLASPNNPYALALAGKRAITIRAKPTLKEGEIERLYISDIKR